MRSKGTPWCRHWGVVRVRRERQGNESKVSGCKVDVPLSAHSGQTIAKVGYITHCHTYQSLRSTTTFISLVFTLVRSPSTLLLFVALSTVWLGALPSVYTGELQFVHLDFVTCPPMLPIFFYLPMQAPECLH